MHVYIPQWEQSELRNGTKKANKIVRFVSKNVQYNLDDNPQLTKPFQPENTKDSARVWENFKHLTLQHCKGQKFILFPKNSSFLDQLKDPDYTDNIRNAKFDVAISEMHDSCAFYHFKQAKIPTLIMSAAMITPDIISLAWNLPLPRSYVARKMFIF